MEENTYNQPQQAQNWQTPETNWEQIIRDHIRSTRGWMTFMGVIQIVIAALYTIMTVGIAIIIMWVPFLLGLYLIRASNRAKMYLEMSNISDLAEYHKQVKNYFQVSGIMTIVSIGLAILFGIIAAAIGFSFAGAEMYKTMGY